MGDSDSSRLPAWVRRIGWGTLWALGLKLVWKPLLGLLTLVTLPGDLNQLWEVVVAIAEWFDGIPWWLLASFAVPFWMFVLLQHLGFNFRDWLDYKRASSISGTAIPDGLEDRLAALEAAPNRIAESIVEDIKSLGQTQLEALKLQGALFDKKLETELAIIEEQQAERRAEAVAREVEKASAHHMALFANLAEVQAARANLVSIDRLAAEAEGLVEQLDKLPPIEDWYRTFENFKAVISDLEKFQERYPINGFCPTFDVVPGDLRSRMWSEAVNTLEDTDFQLNYKHYRLYKRTFFKNLKFIRAKIENLANSHIAGVVRDESFLYQVRGKT